MKKLILALATCFTLTASLAEGEKSIETTKSKPIISNGFLLNFGLGLPTYTPSLNNSLGVQFNLELGNQWYFVKNDKFGVGIKVSWAQFGFSRKSISSLSTFGGNSSVNTLDLRFFKIAPMLSFAVAENFAIDAYLEVAPTFIFQYNSDSDNGYINGGFGVLLAPGIRLRHRKLAAGFDFSVGRINSNFNGTGNSNSNNPNFSTTLTYVIPRVYIGFKF